jgi:two-component system response regulator LytT
MPETASEQISILMIEDDEATAKSMVLILEEFGFAIDGLAHTLEDAITLLNKRVFDIALVDIDLNGSSSGLQLGRMINDHFQIPFIFITGSSDKNILEEAVNAHPAAYLVKPASPASLFVTIQRAIQNFSSYTVARIKPKEETEFFFIKRKRGYQKIEWAEVIALSSEQNYTRLSMADKSDCFLRSTLSMTLKYIIPKHLAHNFVQVNRSEVVQVKYITQLDEEELTTSLKPFTLTKGFQKELKERLNILH